MKTLWGWIIVIIAMILISYALAIAQGKTPADVIRIENSEGEVVLKHKEHVQRAGNDCAFCHHEANEKGVGAESCGHCHTSEEKRGVPHAEKALHKQCIDTCHKPRNVGPRNCKCHGS